MGWCVQSIQLEGERQRHKNSQKAIWCQYQDPLSPPKTSVRTLWHVAFPVGAGGWGTPPRLWLPDNCNVFLPPAYCGLTHPGYCEPRSCYQATVVLCYQQASLLGLSQVCFYGEEGGYYESLSRKESCDLCLPHPGLWSPWVCIFILTPKVLCSEGAMGILPGIILGC